MKSDIEIASECKMKPIYEIAEKIGITEDELEPYGKYKAKVSLSVRKRLKDKPDGKLILVTAINPTPAGEGKTTVTIGLGQALSILGKKCVIALREPSLGPVFGVKGGAAGGGYSQVVPMEDINLHFTGDIHAVTTAHNLLAALIDNHLQQGNALGIDSKTITFKRCLDMNDRALRNVVIGLGGRLNGVPRESGFMISVASEIMAILCIADGLSDLKERFSKIIIGRTFDGKPVTAGDLHAHGAMAALFKDAIKPNLVQTLEGTPCFIHGGPFANIAHGCNSLTATKTALKLGDYVVTEAGFGSDLGAEKFLDIKCRFGGLEPSAIVLVATARALKYNGGVKKEDTSKPDTESLKRGLCNLESHIKNLKGYGVPVVVAINKFLTDTDEEIGEIEKLCKALGAKVSVTEGFAKGGEGAVKLAKEVLDAADNGKHEFKLLYDENLPITEKIEIIAKNIYHAGSVEYSNKAKRAIAQITEDGFGGVPVCIAKTQYSFSDDPKKLGNPEGFKFTVNDVTISAGAGFAVALSGDIMTMPGLPKIPAANNIDIDDDGNITGLF